METEKLYAEIEVFSHETHGSSAYHKEEVFVRGSADDEFAPFSYLIKKVESLTSENQLISTGYVYDSLELVESLPFKEWFERQFSRKLTPAMAKKITILQLPKNKEILDSIELISKKYEILRQQKIIINGKNLPVQLGEWYAKCIFGLKKKKSTSQRGFDFFAGAERVEVKVEWGTYPSQKGVKIRKSLVSLSHYCIIIYISDNFMIREVCFLDSEFVGRKFSSKGHTLFLKDSEVSPYFFSKSNKHLDKVVNHISLLKFASPQFAMKISEEFSQ